MDLGQRPIPNLYEVDHRCRNKACVNPDHLQVLTKELHKHKTRIERMLDEDHGEREPAVAFMRLVPDATNKIVAEVYQMPISTVKKYRNILNIRNEHLHDPLS